MAVNNKVWSWDAEYTMIMILQAVGSVEDKPLEAFHHYSLELGKLFRWSLVDKKLIFVFITSQAVEEEEEEIYLPRTITILNNKNTILMLARSRLPEKQKAIYAGRQHF